MEINDKLCCGPDTDHDQGCMVCGKELYCTQDITLRAICHLCGKEGFTHYFCPEGHYVCDACHTKDILDLVLRVCMESGAADPVIIALRIFDLDKLHMHGPEYHSIVPAVLVAAYGNAAGNKDEEAIREAISRGRSVNGGFCGTHGACGAAIGVGIAYSIIHKVTPYSVQERGLANKMTALALETVAGFGGPRCCKRDSIASIEVAAEHFGCYEHTGSIRYLCVQSANNPMCINDRCPYFQDDKQEA
ncbi:MAG: hypothetical protein GXY20_10960 [Clostridiales bacterium]|nr:hypothetical protein [Clostridiales bacterium]